MTTPERLLRSRDGVLSLLTGVVAAAVVVALRLGGLFEGPVGAATVVLALLVVPTSREFARRVLFSGLLVLGWVQVLWWWPGPTDRTGFAAAIVVGIGAACVAWHVRRVSWRGMFGRFRAVDVLPMLSAAVAMGVMWRWLTPSDGTAALAHLLPGWDNSGHFDMFRMTWLNGQTTDGAPPPSADDVWAYVGYPQGFHATVVSVAELMWPSAIDDVGASLMAYTRGVALVVGGAVAVAVAGLSSLPTMRRRPEIAAPLGGLLLAVAIFGPGRIAIDSGFAAFLVATLLAGSAVFVVLLPARVASPVHLVALSGALLGVAYGWMLLLVTILPIVLGLLMPLRGAHWRAPRRDWVVSIAVVVVTAVAILRGARILMGSGGSDLLTAAGGIDPPPMGLAVALFLASVGASVVAAARLMGSGVSGRRTAWRLGAAASTAPLAVGVLVWLAVMQIEVNGAVSYYFWKMLIGDVVILACVAAAALAAGVRPRPEPAPRGRRATVVAGSAICAVGVTQALGYAGPAAPDVGLSSTEPSSVARAQHDSRSDSLLSVAREVLVAARVPVKDSMNTSYLQDPTTSPMHPINAQQWWLSLNSVWTASANVATRDLAQGQDSAETAVASAEQWLATHDGELIAPPHIAAALADSPGAQRVRTWP
ncbi:hypothetical protein [Cellulomonas fengjieae]|uniref:hypothetical protein n=1 Tax=Cellulomonas fengjieae TaxID=2819978 RepID=UPI001AAE4385|nr:hypothetical protein [Cellulomonas fengjieae]MBO3101388.1 hypothetical protein [Cellulomonas fengjieae]